jgi:hypothetical protein
MTMTIRAGAAVATMSPKPIVSSDVAEKYSAVPRSAGTGLSSSRRAHMIRP